MEDYFLTYRSSRFHYSHWGKGEKLMICFHGYGESAASFAFLESLLGKEYTILAIDMPYHGETAWKEGLFFAPGDLLLILEEITRALSWIRGTWTIMGYSMGGRVALQLLELIPQKVQSLILIAPDGLKVNGWYWLATQTKAGNWLFRQTMRYPGWFFFLLRAGNTLGLVNRSVYKFTNYYIGDHQVRQDLYRRWTVMRGFRPDIALIRSLIKEYKIPVNLLYGKYDRIIRSETGSAFSKSIQPFGSLTILPAGHQLLQIKHIDALWEVIDHNGLRQP